MPNKPSSLGGRTDRNQRSTAERTLAIARRNFKLLVACAVLVPAIALTASLAQDERYTASATLLFRDPGLDEKLFGGASLFDEADPQRAAATNLRLVSLHEISTRTAAELAGSGLSPAAIADQVSISAEGTSDLIAVEAEDPDPAFAARLANTFANEYISFRREADRAKIAEAEALIESELAALSATERAGPAAEQLERRARELKILASLQTGNAELVQAAEPPAHASSPTTKRNVVLGIFLGLMLGVGLTFGREQLDRRLKDTDEISDLFGLPILAAIPESRAIAERGFRRSPDDDAHDADVFRMLRTNLRYFNVGRDVKSIVVTSAVPQDGKTTVAWNLALAEADAGNRVLYLEGDLRRPSLARQLRVNVKTGLSLALAGLDTPEEAMRTVNGVDVLFAGPTPPNPAEMIDSQPMRELIAWGEAHYDRVIIDTPPAATVADAVPLLYEVSGVVLVLRVQHSPRDSAMHLQEQLTNTAAPVLGMVINGVPGRSHRYYYGSPASSEVFEQSRSGSTGSGNSSAGTDDRAPSRNDPPSVERAKRSAL